jgi:hypothetical protein
MSCRKLLFLILILFLACEKKSTNPKVVLNGYIKAANEHNIEKVRDFYSDSIIWHFGSFTFRGKDEAIAPIKFDKGANTLLVVSNIKVSGDTVDFDLLETNDVLSALGVPELHHFPRFIIKDGLIHSIFSRRPPAEFQAYSDSVSGFAKWLSENLSETYNKFWPDGRFNFSEETGITMPTEVMKWRNRKTP